MRLFMAICLPQEIKQQLSVYAQSIGALAERANITREDNFHLTLTFFGDALSVTDACAVLDQVSGTPFKLYSDKPGCFKRGNSSILWLGLKSSAELTALHTQLNAALAQAGFAGENRPYAPHLTLAREVRGMEPTQLPAPPRFIIPVNRLFLMESARISGQLTYAPLYEKPLQV